MSIWNERVKLAATALNNIGVAGFIGGVAAPAFAPDPGGYLRLIYYRVGFGLTAIGMISAQIVIGFLDADE